MYRSLISVLLATFLCHAENALEASDGWMRAMPPGQPTAAAYVSLSNPSDAPVALVAASATFAGTVEFHESLQEDGMWRMRRLEGIVIPAGGSVILEPGGKHLMLFGVSAPTREGDQLTITLELDNGTSLPVAIQVQAPGAAHRHHH